MSQLRDNLNPGLEGERLLHHQHQHVRSLDPGRVSLLVDPLSSDEADVELSYGSILSGGGGGHDSDPPIENENPNHEADECLKAEGYSSSNVLNTSDPQVKGLEEDRVKKRSLPNGRKRKKSTHIRDSIYIPPYKRNRLRRQASVLPSNFLLGGNIRDPLNLASLSDAKVSAELNKETPKSSPLPVQGDVPVFIPKNPHDPLGLTTAATPNAEDMIAGIRINKARKHRHRKRNGRKRTESEASTSLETDTGKKYRLKDQVFQFGNYSHYYGYRNPEQGDSRLWVLKKEFFKGKDVLDIGCNSGHVTLSIARDFEPRRVLGIDIDISLIHAARRNIKQFMTRDPDNKEIMFPRSLPMIYGAMQPPPGSGDKLPKAFPYNVSFAHENYVLTSDALLETVKPEYDVITCFSVTKWIHLNFGDEGLKRFFRRVYSHLKPDGQFILEPQPWSSYSKKKKITEKIHQTYKSVKFFPDQFEDFLVNVVGFSSSESLGTSAHRSKGFQRPLIVFTKCEPKRVSASSSSTSNPSISMPDRCSL